MEKQTNKRHQLFVVFTICCSPVIKDILDPYITSASSSATYTRPDEPDHTSQPAKFSIPLKIFLCHAIEDKEAVRKLYHRLRTEGLEPWLDEEDLLPGQVWEQEIPTAIRAADVILVCLSNNSTTKEGYIRQEIGYALDQAELQPRRTIFIIPIRLEDCPVPERLSRWQWVNLFEERGYARLLLALQKRAQSLKKGTGLRAKLGRAARDPIAQVAVAVIALLWAIYTFYAGNSDQPSPTATATSSTVAFVTTNTPLYGGNEGDTTPVGHYPAGVSSYGAYDMAGNVWEWVQSEYRDYPYRSDDGRENIDKTLIRVARGGSWANIVASVRGAYRYVSIPDAGNGSFGVRCAVSAPGMGF